MASLLLWLGACSGGGASTIDPGNGNNHNGGDGGPRDLCERVLCRTDEVCDPGTGQCIGAGDNRCIDVDCPEGSNCDPATGLCVAEPEDRCPQTPCEAPLVCNAATGQCVEGDPSACEGVTCPEGQRCDLVTGECVADMDLCAGVTCAEGRECDPATGACVEIDLCAGSNCLDGSRCDPATGECVPDDPCADVQCPEGQRCSPENGACFDPCEAVVCDALTRCDPDTATCVPLCQGVVCPEQQRCDDTSGECIPNCQGVECPENERCSDDTGACFDPCEAVVCAAEERCDPDSTECIPRCLGVECEPGLVCDPLTGECIDRCLDVVCPEGQICNPEDGACFNPCGDAELRCGIHQVCDPASGDCVDSPPCAGINCLPGQSCDFFRNSCQPGTRPRPGEMGAECRLDDDCTGAAGICLSDRSTDGFYPRGYCTQDCADVACPDSAICLELNNEPPRCRDTCAADEDCRSDYLCVQFDGVASGVCLPQLVSSCSDPTPCTTDFECNGRRCNVDAGFCEPCNPAGGPCRSARDCIAGAGCFREELQLASAARFRDGYCLPQGCGAGNPCPGGSVCLQIGNDGSTACLGTCDINLTNDCRDGYGCYPLQAGDGRVVDFGVCWLRQCDRDDDCDGDLVCDTVRGLCHPFCDPANVAAACTGPPNSPRGCDPFDGRCFDPCTTDQDCGPHGFCDEEQSRCFHCIDDTDCLVNERCDLVSGRCDGGCTETSPECGPRRSCDVEAGLCQTECSDLHPYCGYVNTCNRETQQCESRLPVP